MKTPHLVIGTESLSETQQRCKPIKTDGVMTYIVVFYSTKTDSDFYYGPFATREAAESWLSRAEWSSGVNRYLCDEGFVQELCVPAGMTERLANAAR